MRRSLAALAVTASLLTPGASQTHLLGSLWGFLTSLWSGAAADAGAGIDLFGRNVAPAPQPTPDAGPGMDPFG
ncbi:MAG TPA: hypothetical protein VGS07_01075 [Thermoanaerobaculia bacterium]|jgi:hypothetical protein|nr:hypothetical protein [Thermoanaerobaculia bacterium]